MKITKVFQTDQGWNVMLHGTYCFNRNRIVTKRFGRGALVLTVKNSWDVMLDAINEFEEGFQLERMD